MELKDMQQQFLANLVEEKMLVNIYLTNGVKLTGRVTDQDKFCLLLKDNGITQMVYKHAVATIMPVTPR